MIIFVNFKERFRIKIIPENFVNQFSEVRTERYKLLLP